MPEEKTNSSLNLKFFKDIVQESLLSWESRVNQLFYHTLARLLLMRDHNMYPLKPP